MAKVGSSSITDERGEIARPAIEKFCSEVASLHGQGHKVVMVTSGAIAAGIPALGLSGARVTDMATLQALSAVGQSRLMATYDKALGEHGLVGGQVLLAPLDFLHRSQYLHARKTLQKLLELGVVPIVNENDAVADDEIRFGDNDRLAAAICTRTPDQEAILAAASLDAIPPLPRRVPRPPAMRSSSWSTSTISSINEPDESNRGSALSRPGMSVSSTSRSAETRLATSAASRSLSPKRISSSATASFSLTIGTTPSSRSFCRVLRAWRYCDRWTKSRGASNT